MKSGFRTHFAWALVVMIGVACGYFAADHPARNKASAPGLATRTSAHSRVQPAPVVDSSGSTERKPVDAAGPNTLTAEQARLRAFEILAVPNRLERMRALCGLLAQVTAENWREVLDSFVRQTAHDGQTHDREWNLMLERVREVAGSMGIEEAFAASGPGQRSRARSYLSDWAEGDPEAALQWFEAQDPEARQQLISPMLSGLTRSDPKQALALAYTQPQSVWEPRIWEIVSAAIRRGGFQAAEDLFASVAADVPDVAKAQVLFQLARSKIEMANSRGQPFEPLTWAEPHLGRDHLGPLAVRDLVSSAAQADPQRAMSWVEDHANRLTPKQLAAAFSSVAGEWQQRAPEELTAWINAHPDHPQRDYFVQAGIAPLLRDGKIEDARRRAATVRNPQIRAELERALKTAESPGSGR